jgi:peptidoglycan/LPS O-acetylase OafA/YrhL
VVIFFQLLRFGPREFADFSRRVFYSVCVLTLLTSFGAVLLTTMEFHDAGVYSAFGQNLMMSVLFLAMLYRRRSLRGQSLSIAICKLLGTACASLAFFFFSSLSHRSVLLPFLYVAIFVYDLLYVGMVYRQQRVKKEASQESTPLSSQAEISL